MSFVSFIIRCFSLFEESINCKDIHFSSYLAHSSCLSSLSPIYYTLKGIIYLPRMIGNWQKHDLAHFFYSPNSTDTFTMIIFGSIVLSLFVYQ